jgi:hypothetical protein
MPQYNVQSGRKAFTKLLDKDAVVACLPRWVQQLDPWLEIGEAVELRDTGRHEVLGSSTDGRLILQDLAGCQVKLGMEQFQNKYLNTLRDYPTSSAS